MLRKKNYCNQLKGRIGENAAADFFRSRGYLIIERNYRNRLGEIDLIAKKKHILVFIEVKARTSTNYGRPEEAVTVVKQKKIKRTALAYMQEKRIKDAEFRFDVIGVMFDSYSAVKINHIPNAF